VKSVEKTRLHACGQQSENGVGGNAKAKREGGGRKLAATTACAAKAKKPEKAAGRMAMAYRIVYGEEIDITSTTNR